MPQVAVQWAGLNNRSDYIKFAGEKVEYYNLMLSLSASNLPFSPGINYQIKKAIRSQQIELNKCARKLKRTGSTIKSAIQKYSTTEQNMLFVKAEYLNGIQLVVGETSDIFDGTVHDIKWWEWSDTWSLVGEAGIVGSVISAIGGFLTGTDIKKDLLELTKNGFGITKDIADGVAKKGSDFNWKTLIGLNVPEKKTFFEALKDNIDDLKIGKTKKVSGNVSAVAKWGGYILTGAISAYDNIIVNEENNTTGRQIAETIGETAITIGMGALATAGATALLSTVGAPAVVIGGAAALATWAVDSVVEHFTGKGVAEFLSDTVLDAGEVLIDKAKDFGEALGDGAKKVAGKISGWWKKAFG